MAVFLNIDSNILNQTQSFLLEGLNYNISTEWNYRSGWYISIFTDEGVLILGGLKVMPDGNLTWRYTRKDGLFSGDIWVDNTEITSELDPVGRDNFGQLRSQHR